MNIVPRIFFWLSLAGLSISLIAPLLTSAASWDEARPGVAVGIFLAFLSLIATTSSVTVRDERGGIDPVRTSSRKRRAGMIYSLLAALTMSLVGAVAYTSAKDASEADIDRRAPSYSQREQEEAVEQGEMGMTNGILAFAGAAVAFVTFMVFLAKQPLRPAVGQPYYQNAMSNGSPGYDPFAHARTMYGPQPAPISQWPGAPTSSAWRGDSAPPPAHENQYHEGAAAGVYATERSQHPEWSTAPTQPGLYGYPTPVSRPS